MTAHLDLSLRRFVLLAGALLAGVATAAPDTPPATKEAAPAGTSFWKIWTKPKVKWVLYDLTGAGNKGARQKIVVETADVRKIGDADVARIRWTHVWGKGKDGQDRMGDSDEGLYTQVAVTSAGLYILSDDMDDARIVEALRRKPSRSEPPKEYKGSKANNGRYLRFDQLGGETVVCYGYEPGPNAPPCDDTCFGELCFSPTHGVVEISGTWAPDMGDFAQKGYER